jgi:O-antigen/teichoic acid export membrane protein
MTSKEDFKRICYYSCRAISLSLFPITFGLVVLGDRIILILFKDAFSGAIPALRIMAFSLLFSSLMNVLTAFLNAGKEEKKVALVIIIATATNIILNLFLIPRFAHIGASISTLVSEIMRFTGNYYYLRKRIFKIFLADMIGKVILACLVMSLFIVLFKEMLLPVLIITAGLLYLVIIWQLRLVSNNEIKKVIDLFRKKALAPESQKWE